MFHAVILAAGKGTRMKSTLPKVLHTLNGKSMIEHVLDSACASGINRITVVVGYGKDLVIDCVNSWTKNLNQQVEISFSLQEEQKGTGHAVMVAEENLKNSAKYVVVLLGDVPLLKSETIKETMHYMINKNCDALVMSTILENATGYGRIIRDQYQQITSIREEKDATETEKKIQEINTGLFIFNNDVLWNYMSKLESKNSQNEYYLTDLIEIIQKDHNKVEAFLCNDMNQFRGVNEVSTLQQLETEMEEQVR
jgi:bifunctional UDP-N-acetylglucosamine pyrophosphorylase/glucosamine-1-phosphate N-acetyltransferase